MGLVFAPAVGAMAGDSSRSEDAGRASGEVSILPASSPGVWGVAARLILDLLAQRGLAARPVVAGVADRGFLVAALAYGIMAGVGLETPAIPIETFPTGVGRDPGGDRPGRRSAGDIRGTVGIRGGRGEIDVRGPIRDPIA